MELATRGVNVTDQAFVLLRDAIMSGELKANTLHSVVEFANQLGVSRTPIREAVLRLADAGMVTIERNRGVRISSSNVEDVRCLFELRLLLEVPAAYAAANRRDRAFNKVLETDMTGMIAAGRANDNQMLLTHHSSFHKTIDSALENKRLDRIVDSLRSATRSRSLSVPRGRSITEIANEHAVILKAIKTPDPAAAAAAMRNHLLISGRLLMQQVAIATGDPVDDSWESTFLGRLGQEVSS
jgi:DNA-binding GntR family transcriptional regulator